jgi:outer membrane protein TolC
LINFEKAMNTAKDFIYLPANATLKLTSPLTFVPLEIPVERLIEIGLEKNPSLRSSKRDVTLAEMNFRETKEGNRPRFNAIGSYTETLDHSNAAAPISPFSWELKLGLEWPLFDATQTRLRSNQSEISLLNTRRSYENDARQLKVAIQNAYLEVKRTEEQISDFAEQRDSAEKNVHAIRLQYRNGLSRLIDVFDAENELRDLQLEYLNLLVSFNTAQDQLSLLVGEDITKLPLKDGKR